MVAVLISIQPKWVKMIAEGKKTIEVRKSRPKPSVPFKCYIYCTVDGFKSIFQKGVWLSHNGHVCNGKVVGEFICKSIGRYPWINGQAESYYTIMREEGELTCLSYDEIVRYGAGQDIFFWDISDLKIYDKPLELTDFGIDRAPQDWRYVDERQE